MTQGRGNFTVIMLGNYEDLEQPQFKSITRDLEGEIQPAISDCIQRHPL